MRYPFSWLDLKLGFRMLLKYPGLTLVGGLAIAFAIWVGAGGFELISQVIRPTLPLPGGARVVSIQQQDAETARTRQPTLHDFTAWRGNLRSVQNLGAFRLTARNLITGDERGEPVEVAEISASGFRVASVPPSLGRVLVAADEHPSAPPVAVIGHEVWRQRFNADPNIVGREIRLGRTAHTVVGVMPEGFGFPVSQNLWVPLRLNALDYPPGEAPAVRVFGRLAPGATLDEAQAELAALGRRVAADQPETHRHLRPEVLPYAKSILNLPTLAALGLGSVNLFLLLLVVLVCSNVALLMFARAASRENELAVRSALGASRGRIIAQLFAEALVLAAIGAALGLAAVRFGLRWAFSMVASELAAGSGGRAAFPFWLRPDLSPATVAYALGLTVLAALVAGVVPGLKVTRGLRAHLQRATAGGGGFRFGGVWTAVIVAQIAITLAFPVAAFFVNRDIVQIRSFDLGIPDEQFLAVRVEMDRAESAGTAAEESTTERLARYSEAVRELEERLAAEPAVAGVTFAERLPRMYHPHRIVEVDEGGAAAPRPEWPDGYRVSSASVAPDFFDVLQTPILAGRGFHSGDLQPDARSVIVNQSFVERVLGGRNPIGRRVRYTLIEDRVPRQLEEPSPWYEIVGVVPDRGMSIDNWDPKIAGFYHPVAPGGIYPGQLAVQVRGDPATFAPRLRAIATRVDPTLRLYDVQPLDQANNGEVRFLEFWFWMTAGVSALAMLLSLAGIYAVMSFTVSQRTREIGIRIALGASARSVVSAIFRRPLRQVGLGIAMGAALCGLLLYAIEGSSFSIRSVTLVAVYAVLMLGVCLLACIVPTRRALRIQPTEALRADG